MKRKRVASLVLLGLVLSLMILYLYQRKPIVFYVCRDEFREENIIVYAKLDAPLSTYSLECVINDRFGNVVLRQRLVGGRDSWQEMRLMYSGVSVEPRRIVFLGLRTELPPQVGEIGR
jgi:hypothetical protein